MSRGNKQSVVLVDARDGKEQGTILHHPLFVKLTAQGQSIPGELLGSAYHVPPSLVAGEATLDYVDPLSKYSAPNRPALDDAGRLLAASSPVLPPIGAAPDFDSGLVVVVQSDYDSVIEPTRQLGQQVMRSSFWMFVVIATGGFSMLYIVTGTLRELSTRLPTPDSLRQS
jgi:hypothetical protein